MCVPAELRVQNCPQIKKLLKINAINFIDVLVPELNTMPIPACILVLSLFYKDSKKPACRYHALQKLLEQEMD